MSRLSLLVYRDSTETVLIANWASSIIDLSFETDEHGYAILVAFISMPFREAIEMYRASSLAHVVLTDGVFDAFQGRVEDREISTSGLRISAVGYQNAVNDMDYRACWSLTRNDLFDPLDGTTRGDAAPELYTFTVGRVMKIGLKPDTNYHDGNYQGQLGFYLSGTGDVDLSYAEFGYVVKLPSQFTAKLLTTTSTLSGSSTTEWSLVGDGSRQQGSTTEVLQGAAKSIIFQVEPTADYIMGQETIGVERGAREELTTAWATTTADYKYATKYPVAQTFDATKMSVYLKGCGSSEHFALGIYSDSGGSPGTLLGYTYEMTGLTDRIGKFTAELGGPVTLTAGNDYWLALIADDAFDIETYTSAFSGAYNADTYSDGFASSFGTPTTNNVGYMITAFADEWEFSLSGVRITADDSTIYADDVAKNIVDYINNENPKQLSDDVSMIQSPGEDLEHLVVEDQKPRVVLDTLANIGDSSTPPVRYEWGVWEDRRLHFRPKYSEFTNTWYVDFGEIAIKSTFETMANRVYVIYRDESGRRLWTADSDDEASQSVYDLIRYRSLNVPVTNLLEAQVWRDAYLEDAKSITPQAQITTSVVFDQAGSPADLYRVRAGDMLEIRGMPVGLLGDIDNSRTIRIARTNYDVTTRQLTIYPGSEYPLLDLLIARNSVSISSLPWEHRR